MSDTEKLYKAKELLMMIRRLTPVDDYTAKRIDEFFNELDRPPTNAIKSWEYKEETESLFIKFHWQDGIYQYHDVKKDVVTKLELVESKSKYFAEHIKDVYRYTKVDQIV